MIAAYVCTFALLLGISAGRTIYLHRHQGQGPSDTVARFFTALRDNRAAAALAELASPPPSTRFITDDVLRAGHQDQPIGNISVPVTTALVVPVTYTLGQETVTDTISLTPVGSGFKIITAVNTGGIPVGSQRRPGLPASLAGVEITDDVAFLLPGSYPLTTPTPHLAYGRSKTVTVKRLADTLPTSDFAPQLTTAGRTAVTGAVTASLTACATQHSFAPAGCPFRLSGGVTTTADPAGSTWTVLSAPPADMKIVLGADLTKSTVEVPLSMRITFPPGTNPPALDLPRTQAIGRVNLLDKEPTIVWTG